jgi:hypothetical protein
LSAADILAVLLVLAACMALGGFLQEAVLRQMRARPERCRAWCGGDDRSFTIHEYRECIAECDAQRDHTCECECQETQ